MVAGKSLETRSKFPFWTAAAVAATVVVFAGQQLSGAPMSAATLEGWGSRNGYEIWSGSRWALFTSPFLHIGWEHVGYNLLCLWYLGRPVERVLGSVRFLLFFAASAWVSGAAQLVGSDADGIGLSGVVFALFGFSWVARARFPELRKQVGTGLIVYFLISLVGGIVVSRLGILPIGNIAHFAGLFFGLLTGAAILPRAWAAAALTCVVAAVSLALFWAPWSPTWNGVQGNAAYVEGNLDAALSHFTRAVELEPEYLWAHEQLGYCHSDRGDYETAINVFNAVLAKDAEYAEAFAGRGHARRMLGKQQQALIDLQRAIELSPEYAYAHQQRGWCHSELEDHAKALEAFTVAARLAPNEVWNHAGLGRTYLELGRLAEADEALARAIELDPKLAFGYDELGWLRLDQERPRDAVQEFSTALALDSEYYRSLQGRGRAHRKLGEVDRAIEDLQRAVELEPESLWTLVQLGWCHCDRGDHEAAVKSFTGVLTKDA
ncbi:MAG: rhomboid family intramembrane serine protease, partial [Planctomycetota bacterium]